MQIKVVLFLPEIRLGWGSPRQSKSETVRHLFSPQLGLESGLDVTEIHTLWKNPSYSFVKQKYPQEKEELILSFPPFLYYRPHLKTVLEKIETVWVLQCAYGLLVQTICNTDVYFPANVLFYIRSKQWFSRCLSWIFAPVWGSQISNINISSYKCKLLGHYPTSTKSGTQHTGEPTLYVSTHPAGDFNLHSWLRAPAPWNTHPAFLLGLIIFTVWLLASHKIQP